MLYSLNSILAPAHLFAYSTLLGTQLYQTFIITKVAFQALPRSSFTTLQKRLFPLYFKSQSLLLLAVVVTAPPQGVSSIVRQKQEWIPLVVACSTAGLNLMIYGPRTRELMIERVHQGTRDAALKGRQDGISDAMKGLNKSFSRAHAMSIHLNLITIGATLWYGWQIASRFRVDLD